MKINCRVIYSYWQMECCGDPFKPGDTVNWRVLKDFELTVSDDVNLGNLDYCYEAHGNGDFHLTGVVTQIWGLYEEYRPAGNRVFVPVHGELVELSNSESAERVQRVGPLEISAYVVELENCSVTKTGSK